MPEQLDPAWEYWTPDPEIAEVMDIPVTDLREMMVDICQRTDHLHTVTGFRFGKKISELRLLPRLGPEKPTRLRGRPPIHQKQCVTCGKEFVHRKSYHCIMCRASGANGRPRTLLDIPCQHCGIPFRRKTKEQKFCSVRCVRRAQGCKFSPAPPDNKEIARFGKHYVCGESLVVLSSVFDMTTVGLTKWRKRLSLTPRPSGNPHRCHPSSSGEVLVGMVVRLLVPENPLVHLTLAIVTEVTGWGAHVRTPVTYSKRYRVLFSEMEVAVDPVNEEKDSPKEFPKMSVVRS